MEEEGGTLPPPPPELLGEAEAEEEVAKCRLMFSVGEEEE
jgi:hypothetical protein